MNTVQLTRPGPRAVSRRVRLSATGAVLAAVAALAGCGSGNSAAVEIQRSDPPHSAGSAPTGVAEEGSGAVPFHALREWGWTTSDASGYTANYSLALEPPAQVSQVAIHGGWDRASTASLCPDIDPQTDGLIPVRLTISSTTTGFSQTAAAFTSLEDLQSSVVLPDTVEVETLYSDGPSCVDMATETAGNDQTNWQVSCRLSANASCTNYAYLVAKGYLSPANPTGDPDALQKLNLAIGVVTTDDSRTVDTVSGDGIEKAGLGVTIPLFGVEPPAPDPVNVPGP